MSDHRSEDRKRVLPQLQGIAQSLIESAAAAQIMLGQLQLWSGPTIDDFGGKENPAGQPRLDETQAAMSAAAKLFTVLESPTPGFEQLTIKQSLLRIAKR